MEKRMMGARQIWAPILCALLAACAPDGPSADPAGNETAAADGTASINAANGVEAPPDPISEDGTTNGVSSPPPIPAPEASTVTEGYSARGQEPGWLLTIAKGRIDYTGNYGEKHINVALPTASKTADGWKFETARLSVEITPGRCNDAMSGQGFADTVTIAADGEKYQGCGGARKPAWDM